jgi:hypothetical protein
MLKSELPHEAPNPVSKKAAGLHRAPRRQRGICPRAGYGRAHKVSNYYAAVSALIFAVVALAHLGIILKQWTVQIGSLAVPMSVSWIGLVIAALLPIWDFLQLG